MKKALLALCTGLLVTGMSAQSINYGTNYPATDALGRALPTYGGAGSQKEKYVAIFYWTWHQGKDDTSLPVRNISEIVRKYPEAMKDADHPAWGSNKPGFFFWEQPLFGYYRTTDTWVLRRHAEMLADAGVDAVFFDCTNGSLTWEDSYEALLATWDKAQKDGVKTPGIAYMLPFGAAPHSLESLRQLYRDVYKPGRYKNLWFMWKGKPCIMAYPDNLTDSEEDREIREFFTFRPGQPDYVDGPFANRNDQWAWLENYPQHGYVKGADGRFEQVAVGIAQNAAPETKGHCSAFNLPGSHSRSFTVRNGFDPRSERWLYGWNFDEQWDRAYELDPELVFVTGWNEYTAGMWFKKDGWTGVPFSFVDQFDWDRSRDIEPNAGWGDKGDVYYYQLIEKIRKFKGMIAPERASEPKSIKIGHDAAQWDEVKPSFTHYKGSTPHRDHPGRGNTHYTNTSGRNDIVGAKVARDNEMLYFRVETAEKLTPATDRNWMMLFIDIDRDKSTGWNGYDFIINRLSPQKNRVTVEQNIGGRWEWSEIARVKCAIGESSLEIEMPRSLLGEGQVVDFEFKWNDNMQENGNIMDFYVNGDTAPGGRFNYMYSEQ
jgi:hypothetical protein